MFTSFLFANILKEGDFLMGVDKKWGMEFLGEKEKRKSKIHSIFLQLGDDPKPLNLIHDGYVPIMNNTM